MGIALTDDHRELSGVARAFLTSQKVRWAARASLDAAGDARPPFWQNLAELGWLGLHIDERHGGSGYGLSELVVVIEELGRAVAPGLFVPTVIASAVVAKEGTDDQRARLLPALIDGTLTAGVGLDSQVQVTDGVADGEAGIVLGAGLAELLLVAAGDDVLVLERGRKGVSVDVPENFDPTRRSGRVRLDNVRVTTDDILLGAYESALARARTLLAAEAVGGAADCVDSAVAYAKVRQQFGRTIATFQAVKHHCANMLVAAESAIAAVWDAARAAAEDEEQFRLAAAVAAALAFPAYARNAELNIQVHGGIGFTWEHDAHLHLRRALVTVGLFGGDAPVRDVFERTAAGVTRAISLDLPAQAEELRARIRSDAAEIAALEKDAQRDKLIETGYVMPHWPRPWGRAAGAVEQLVIEEEFSAAGIERPDYSITGWVILTLIQHGTPWQIERFVEKALPLVHTFCPLIFQPPSTRVARVLTEAASDPASGSENSWHHISCWRSHCFVVRATAADADPLVAQRCPRHRPPGVRRPDNVLIGDEDIVEEHLVEFRVAGDLPQRPHLDTGGQHVDDHRGDASVFGGIRIGTHGSQATRAVLRFRRATSPSSKWQST